MFVARPRCKDVFLQAYMYVFRSWLVGEGKGDFALVLDWGTREEVFAWMELGGWFWRVFVGFGAQPAARTTFIARFPGSFTLSS